MLGTVAEPARDVPVLHDVDVLVVGGGPAGTTAAISAARLGARVMLVERYNHLGGLSTGGLVIWIDRMTDWNGKLVIQGLGAGTARPAARRRDPRARPVRLGLARRRRRSRNGSHASRPTTTP